MKDQIGQSTLRKVTTLPKQLGSCVTGPMGLGHNPGLQTGIPEGAHTAVSPNSGHSISSRAEPCSRGGTSRRGQSQNCPKQMHPGAIFTRACF